jgi:hypothetical protein
MTVFRLLQLRVPFEDKECGIPSELHQVGILENVTDLERRQSTLGCAQNVARSSDT